MQSMTEIRHSGDTPMQKFLHQYSLRDTYRFSCNSTPESNEGDVSNVLINNHQQNPLMQSFVESASMTTNRNEEMHFDNRKINYSMPTSKTSTGNVRAMLQGHLRSNEHFKTIIAPTHPTPIYSKSLTDSKNENGENFSNYTNTAMKTLRSGSSSSMVGIIDNSNMGISGSVGGDSTSSSSLAAQHDMSMQRAQYNVAFSNYKVDQQLSARPTRYLGSLRRNKGRSNQSLCSCDAGDYTEMNPNPVRPLFQYSLERRHKAHTYTCEQNAQILIRLHLERHRRLSLGAADISNIYNTDLQSDALSSSDVDTIPPIPPPPSLQRKASFRNQRLIQSQNHERPLSVRTNGNLNTHSAIAVLSNNEIVNCCDNGTLNVDAATSINCANVSDNMATNRTVQSPGVTMQSTRTLNVRREAYRPGGNNTNQTVRNTYFGNHHPHTLVLRDDDICTPNSKKSNLSLCFLHKGPNGITTPDGPIWSRSYHDLRHGDGEVQKNLSTSNLGIYNTIGQSSDCVRQLPEHNQQKENQDPQRLLGSCRCFSQSLSSFERKYFGQQKNDGTYCDSQNTLIYHMGGEEYDSQTGSNALSTAAAISNSSTSGLNEKLHQQLHNHHDPYERLLLPATPCPIRHHHIGNYSGRQQQLPLVVPGSQQLSHKPHHVHATISSIMPWKHRQCPSRGSSSSGTSSFRFDAAKHWLAVSSILLIIGAASVAVPLALRVPASAPFEERLRAAVQLLDEVPLIDGHNDLPWNIRKFLHNKLDDFNFDEDLRNAMPWARSHWSHTDLQRMKKGRITAQFWAAYVPCEAQHRDAVQLTLEQIDVIKRLTDRYSPQLTTCTTSDDIIEAHKHHQLCSLTGVEGGHSLGGSLAVLRTLYAIGVRYMTLTSTCHTPWADSSYADAPTFNVKHGGLTIFGKTIIQEMNRLGMMVDLSHVSTGTMRDALLVSEAPVIFSHSSAYELCNSSRNVKDDMLQSLAKNGGLVMVNFYSKFLSCNENSTVHDAVAHINHIKRVAGIDHVGLGAGYDGINFTPKGLEDVSSYPTLFAELLGVGWSVDDLTKLAGGNFLRVMKQVERIRNEKKTAGVRPFEDQSNFRIDDPYNCTSS